MKHLLRKLALRLRAGMRSRVSRRRTQSRFRRSFVEQLEDRSLLAEITGIAFQDLDDDGLYEPSGGESTISGLTMYLDVNANGRFDGPSEPSLVTDSAGRYSFDHLGPNRYLVGQVPSLNWIQTSPDQQTPTIRNLDITAEDILYDPSRNKIFASLAGQTKLAVIDPVSGTVQLSVEVGENLGQLALSDDGRWLYVSVLGGAAVRRVDLLNGTVGPQFTLGSHPQFGPYYVDDMAVMPGNPDVVAISRRRPGVTPPHGGVAIFENGVQRPVVTPDHTGPNLITFGDSPGTLYGQESYFSDGAFYRMTIDASGVRVTDTMGNYSVRDIEYDNGRIYSSTGTVVDPVEFRLDGSFSRSGGGNVVAANPVQDVGYLVTNINSGGYRLEAFDRQSFLPLEKFDLPNLGSTPLQLVRWGDRGLALRTSAGKVTLIEWDPRPATRAVDVSSGLTASGINFGNRPAVELGSITGQVFEDLDRNGVKAASEPGIPGRVVYLDQNGNSQLDDGERRTQSDASGNYVFAGLQPGSYFVTESVDTGVRQTSPAPQEARVRRLDLKVNDLVYDSSTGKILASVPSEVGLRGNSITAINPATGVIEKSTFIGSEPTKLALSDDGQVLYAALDGAGAVRQFQVDNQQAGLQFWLGQERFGAAVFASDLAVMPGNSQVVVAALETKSSLNDERTGIALYQQGVERDAFDRLTAVGPVEFSTGSLLFSATRLNQLARIEAIPTDLNFLEQTATPVNIGSEFEHDNGRLYSTTGKIFDGTTGLSVGSYPASGAVEPDSDKGITYFVSSGVIKAFDQQTGALIRSVTIPGASSLHSTLIRWGEHGLAFDSFTASWLVDWDPRSPSTNRFHTVHLTSGQAITGKDFGNIAVNAPPFAAADSYTTREDTLLSIAAPGVLGNDVGDAGKSLTLVSHTAPANGTLTANPDGSFTYTPALHFYGTDTFSYVATDGTSPSNSATVTITVTAIAPVITSNGGGATASISVPENSTAVTDVDATDPAPPPNLTYSVAGGADAARFSIHPTTGVLRFISSRDFEHPNDVGADNIYEVIVRVTDGSLSDTQTITVTVTNIVELPNITSDGGGLTASISVPENAFLVTDVNSPDEVGTTLAYSISGGADAFKFSINDATGLLSFTAAPNFESPTDVGGNNVYDVIVQVNNGTVTDTQAIAVTVTNSNDLPVPFADAYSTSEDALRAIGPIGGVLSNDTDDDVGDSKTVVSVAGGGVVWDEKSHGDLPDAQPFPVLLLAPGVNEIRGTTGDPLHAPSDLDAFIILVPEGLQVTSMTYSVARATGGIRQVNWSVPPLGSFGTIVPHATSTLFSSWFPLGPGQYTFREVSFSKDGTGNPSDLADYSFRFNVTGEPAVGRQITLPSGALLTLQPDGSFQYDPNGKFESLSLGQSATDVFTYTVADGQGSISPATVTIAIDGTNDAPRPENDVREVGKNGLLDVAAGDGVLANDLDVDTGDTKTVVAINGQGGSVGEELTLASGAKLLVRADGSYRYDPNGKFSSLGVGQSATETFTYEVADIAGAISLATVTIQILGPNIHLVVVAEDGAYAAPAFAQQLFVGLPPGGDSNLIFETSVDGAILFAEQPQIDATGTLTFKPAPNSQGTAVVTVLKKPVGAEALEGEGAFDTAEFLIDLVQQAPWQNDVDSNDVNDDGNVVAEDVLLVINFINAAGSGALTNTSVPKRFFDADGDNYVAAGDVVKIINFINAKDESEGESGGEQVTAANSSAFEDSELLSMLAGDVVTAQARRRRVGAGG